MSYHRFAVLTQQGESGVKSAEFEALFASDVVLYSPFLLKPLSDKALTIRFLSEVFASAGYPRYTHQFTDDQRTTLFLLCVKREGSPAKPVGDAFQKSLGNLDPADAKRNSRSNATT